MYVPAGRFKTHCLRLINEVQTKRSEIIVTKRGKPVAKLVPLEEAPPVGLMGYLKGSVTVDGDVVQPIDASWEAEADDR